MASGNRELRAQLQELKNVVKRKDKEIANVVRYADEKRRKDRTQLESMREELRSKEKVSEQNAQLQLEIQSLKEQMAEKNTHLSRQLDSVKEQLRRSEVERVIINESKDKMAEQNAALESEVEILIEKVKKCEEAGVIINESKDKMAEQNSALESEVENLTERVKKYEEATTEQNDQRRRAIEAVNREFTIWRLEAKIRITQKENELFELKKDYEALTRELAKIKKRGMKARLLGCLRRIFRRRH